MKLEKAIYYIDNCMSETEKILYPEVWQAHQMASKSLEARKVWQDNEGFDPAEALPGETEE